MLHLSHLLHSLIHTTRNTLPCIQIANPLTYRALWPLLLTLHFTVNPCTISWWALTRWNYRPSLQELVLLLPPIFLFQFPSCKYDVIYGVYIGPRFYSCVLQQIFLCYKICTVTHPCGELSAVIIVASALF